MELHIGDVFDIISLGFSVSQIMENRKTNRILKRIHKNGFRTRRSYSIKPKNSVRLWK